ncbi:family 10 glycosylhydrolase [Candidatus Sumerlaeota bacterium]|nr:family 10 glycosylhydrolase [Candidatus Sumerlaeota bacterium]
MMKIERVSLSFLIFAAFLFLRFPANADRTLDAFDFATTTAARAAWKPASGVSQVGLYEGIPLVENPGVRFPCNFTQVENRCYWDMAISEDFTSDTLVKLRIHIQNPLPISSLTLYFKSGGGWYSNTFGNLKKGWQTLSCARSNFKFSGAPTGWHAIDGVRFSPWKGQGVDTEIIANELILKSPGITVVKGTKSTYPSTAESTHALICSCLDAWNIDYGFITEENVEEGALLGARLAIFPYSNNMSSTEIAKIQSFVSSGGKIILFFTAPTEVFNLLGIQYKGSSGFAVRAMQFQPDIVDCVPSYIGQASWNFFKAQPVAPDVRILARWEDSNGILTEWPAWTIGDNGAYMSHILLSDDLENKKKLMLALVVHFAPEAVEDVLKNAVDGIGMVGEYANFDEAVDGIRSSALLTPRIDVVEERLTSATLLRSSAVESLTSGTFCQKLDEITSARLHLLEAFYLAQKSRLPEFRAVWASYSATSGPFAKGWDIMADDLSRFGFHAVMPYMATGGVAYYDSDYLPRYDGYDVHGDHIAACVNACKSKRIQTHVRKLNYFLLNAPQSFIDDMRAQNRTQVDVDGNDVDYLCPSHPLNHQLELNVMLEIIDNYDIDGIHYDFIRYPDEKCCYCAGCRERFQNDTGIAVASWPLDCYSGVHKEAYREWRREQITKLVRDMRTAVNLRGNKVKISAAVFSSYPSCRTSVAQDWASWIENGYLDFVCPMNYTNSSSAFQSMLQNQLNYVAGRAPLYPGVGVASGSSSLTADQLIVQLLITRLLNTKGYVLFVYGDYLSEEILPHLHKGFTADPPQNAFLFH